jgi:hypothetical protein
MRSTIELMNKWLRVRGLSSEQGLFWDAGAVGCDGPESRIRFSNLRFRFGFMLLAVN